MFRHRVTPNFFQHLIFLSLRRDFTAADNAQAPSVVIISESMAQRYWPNEDPIGKRFREDSHAEPTPEPWLSVVGVVGEVKYRGLPQNPNADPDVYFSWLQGPSRDLNLAVRSSSNPKVWCHLCVVSYNNLTRTYRFTLLSQCPNEWQNSRNNHVSPRDSRHLCCPRTRTLAVGIYSVMSYAVQQRSREIGIRIALGARRVDVLRMVIGCGNATGRHWVVLGFGAALALTQFMRQLLFGLAPFDALTYAFISILLSLVVLFACWLPGQNPRLILSRLFVVIEGCEGTALDGVVRLCRCHRGYCQANWPKR